VQANLWTEYIAYPELIEYQVLPRMAALAEVQWSAPEGKDYKSFLSRLPRLLNIYKQEGWHYCEVRGEW
jgi:hexosaminidase